MKKDRKYIYNGKKRKRYIKRKFINDKNNK